MNLINSIKLYKSSGIRDISSRLLKDGLSALPEQIKFIFNLSLSKCSIPKSWNEVKVTPIPKNGDMSDINNIRPISQTPIIGKLLEKHVNEQIVTYLEDNKLLYPYKVVFIKSSPPSNQYLIWYMTYIC